MAGNRVCAVVVTFHPSKANIQNLEKLRPQVETLVVVDNGSAEEELTALRVASRSFNAVLIENGLNLGIAAALNTGVRWAMAHQLEWVVLFDQDSAITDGFVETLLDDMKAPSRSSSTMQVIPRYRDPVTGDEEVIALDKDGGPFITRTSGSFFPVRVFEECGFFAEELFIYCVDDDFSLRLRSRGFSIAQSRRAILLHSAGNPSQVSIFGKTFTTKNYRPEIQYYWARNRVWLMRKHGRRYPHIIYSSLRSLFGVPLKIALGEKMRGKKMRMFTRGVFHGLLGKTGRQMNIP